MSPCNSRKSHKSIVLLREENPSPSAKDERKNY